MLQFGRFSRKVLKPVIVAMLALATVGNGPSSSPLPAIGVTVRILEQSGPVSIVGIKAIEGPGQYVLVHYRNNSAKRTLRVWLEAVVSGRQGGSVHISSNGPNEFWPAERTIPPRSDAWARETALSSSSLLMAGKGIRSNCLVVGVFVQGVDFEGGSSWSGVSGNGSKVPNKIEDLENCKAANGSASDIERLIGVSTEFPSSHSKDPDEVKSYSFLCSLRPRGSDFIAVCPF